MNIHKLKAWSALSALVCAFLLAAILIIRIWFECASEILWKSASTVCVLFFLSALTHVILQGMTQKTDGKE